MAQKTKRVRQGLFFFLFIVLSAGLFSLLTRQGQQSYDAWRDQIRTGRNWVNYKLGRPLRGTPDLSRRKQRLAELKLASGNPIFIRIFKMESELELWMKNEEGFKLFATYPICRWSGRFGPKIKEGDGQSPEGVYTVTKRQLNYKSRWYKSFNLGYPNYYDRNFNRTGSYLMIHGGCSSIGCYAMTNPVMKEIWDLVLAGFKGGQKSFTVHAFPFRMTDRNLTVYSQYKSAEFWNSLKPAYDIFNETNIPPEVSVCKKQYQFKTASFGDKSYDQFVKKGCQKPAPDIASDIVADTSPKSDNEPEKTMQPEATSNEDKTGPKKQSDLKNSENKIEIISNEKTGS